MAEPAYVPTTHEEVFLRLRADLERETSHDLFNRIEVQLLMPTGNIPPVLRATLDVLRSRAG